MTADTDTRFGKTSRLLKASEYKRVFDHAPFRASHENLLILSRENELDHARLGLVVAKKNVRLAVSRNRFKRIVRESFRKQHLPPIDVIVLARRNADALSNSDLLSLLDQLWKRVAKKASKALAQAES